MGELVVKAEKLTKTYKLLAEEITAVHRVDLQIESGEFVSIMGPSGSGKTTLLDMIGCLDHSTSGRLQVLGEDVSKMKESRLVKIRRGQIGFVFQDFSLIPTLTALENVQLASHFAGLSDDRSVSAGLLEKSRSGAQDSSFTEADVRRGETTGCHRPGIGYGAEVPDRR